MSFARRRCFRSNSSFILLFPTYFRARGVEPNPRQPCGEKKLMRHLKGNFARLKLRQLVAQVVDKLKGKAGRRQVTMCKPSSIVGK